MSNPEFYTATMANLYAQQGHFQRAAEIYRYILSREPHRRDVAEALSKVEQQSAHMESESDPDTRLVDLFKEWFHLAGRYQRLQALKRLRQNLLSR